MARLVWDRTGERYYETGLRQGVLYPQDISGLYPKGVVWNGLSSVSESPEGAEANAVYADDIKYLALVSVEELNGSIEAYTYPDEFAACDGTIEIVPGVTIGQQKRSAFGTSYRTVLGNDLQNEDYGYKLHLIYGALASPSERTYQTINDSPEAVSFSWDYTTTPVSVTGRRPTASVVINSTKVNPAKLKALEDILYGTDDTVARLPLPDEVFTLIGNDTAVVPTAPTIAENTIDIPTVTGIDYMHESSAITSDVTLTSENSPYAITAVAKTGYYIPSNAVKTWTFTYTE